MNYAYCIRICFIEAFWHYFFLRLIVGLVVCILYYFSSRIGWRHTGGKLMFLKRARYKSEVLNLLVATMPSLAWIYSILCHQSCREWWPARRLKWTQHREWQATASEIQHIWAWFTTCMHTQLTLLLHTIPTHLSNRKPPCSIEVFFKIKLIYFWILQSDKYIIWW